MGTVLGRHHRCRETGFEHAILTKAYQALKELSADEKAREAAFDRQWAIDSRRIELAVAREEGRAEGLRAAIESPCPALEIPLDPERRRALDELDADGLDRLVAHLRDERRWPAE